MNTGPGKWPRLTGLRRQAAHLVVTLVNLRKSLLSIVLAYSTAGKRCLQSCLVQYQRGEQFDEVLGAPRAVRLFTCSLLLLQDSFIISTSSFSAIAFSTPEEDLPGAVVIMFQGHFPQPSTTAWDPPIIHCSAPALF